MWPFDPPEESKKMPEEQKFIDRKELMALLNKDRLFREDMYRIEELAERVDVTKIDFNGESVISRAAKHYPETALKLCQQCARDPKIEKIELEEGQATKILLQLSKDKTIDDPKVAALLVKSGADVTATFPGGGNNAITFALQYGHDKEAEVLLKALKDQGKSLTPGMENHAVFCAALSGDQKCMDALKSNGIDINKSSALVRAVKEGNEPAFELLMVNDADPRAANGAALNAAQENMDKARAEGRADDATKYENMLKTMQTKGSNAVDKEAIEKTTAAANAAIEAAKTAKQAAQAAQEAKTIEEMTAANEKASKASAEAYRDAMIARAEKSRVHDAAKVAEADKVVESAKTAEKEARESAKAANKLVELAGRQKEAADALHALDTGSEHKKSGRHTRAHAAHHNVPDGHISPREFAAVRNDRGKLERFLDELDTDRDGHVSKEELTRAAQDAHVAVADVYQRLKKAEVHFADGKIVVAQEPSPPKADKAEKTPIFDIQQAGNELRAIAGNDGILDEKEINANKDKIQVIADKAAEAAGGRGHESLANAFMAGALSKGGLSVQGADSLTESIAALKKAGVILMGDTGKLVPGEQGGPSHTGGTPVLNEKVVIRT